MKNARWPDLEKEVSKAAWPDFAPDNAVARQAVSSHMGRYFPGSGPMEARNEKLLEWHQARVESGLWPYSLSAFGKADVECKVRHPSGPIIEGVNFTAVDYMGLSFDDRLAEVAIQAIRDFGHHTPSSRPLMGNSPRTQRFESEFSGFLGRRSVFLCPTGWAAAYAAVTGVVRRDDHVVMDELAHSSLQNGAAAATQKIQIFRHLENESLREKLSAIRAEDAKNAILVMTEGLFSMDGDSPDLAELVEISKEYGATVLVDVAHDLGATGPQGTGTAGRDGVLQDIDILVGAFSKSFGTNGGFISTSHHGMEWAQLCFGSSFTFSTGISPAQVAVAAAALKIVSGDEGDQLRRELMKNVSRTRSGAEERGLSVLGAASPIVPVLVGKESVARLAGMYSFQAGLIATCLEFPVVQRGASRYRISMSPRYSEDQIDRGLDIIAASVARATEVVAAMSEEPAPVEE